MLYSSFSVSHLTTYVYALYARNMSGEPKTVKISGRQYQTKPDQQEFYKKYKEATLQGDTKMLFLNSLKTKNSDAQTKEQNTKFYLNGWY